jgi:starch synthase (maltosyl-transferring)
MSMASDGRRRVQIEGVKPEVDGGRFAIKRVVGERVEVEADIFSDGHDVVAARLLYRRDGPAGWRESPMEFLVNDRWRGEFKVEEMGEYFYTIEAWVDHYLSWLRDLRKRLAAGSETATDFLIGAELIEGVARQAGGEDAARLGDWARRLRERSEAADRAAIATEDALVEVARRYPDRRFAARYGKELRVAVDRARAGFSAWYEVFPRSCAPEPERHGTLQDCMERLPYIAGMGFDVVYLPPIHPIGRAFRKGKNNRTTAEPDDVGSPWAIGAEEGGHKAIHPPLGTVDDFRALVAKAREMGMEIAMDLAYQCSPDHPYVKEHPQWFRWRPDGTVQYAENPPKKYQDIYPVEFENDDWKGLWEELRSVVLHWVEQGVRIFRVDNPHTKPFAFWEWMIADVKRQYPDVLFLAEAFTRPKVMYRLAKLGFTQSYTYFSWRNTRHELTEYFTELTRSEVKEFFDPLWYKDAIIYETHVKAFFDGNNDGIGDFPGPAAEARLHAGPRRHVHLAAAVLSVAACATTATTSPTTEASTPTTARWRTSRRSWPRRTNGGCR